MSRWAQIETIVDRLKAEEGTLFKEAPFRVALCYPSPYRVGMSSLGFQTIYRETNEHEDVSAERAFLPDDPNEWRTSGMPLVSYERQRPISEFDMLAFSVAYEMEITGIFEMLDLAGIPVHAAERDSRHPLVVAGGPLTFSNPMPLVPYVDVVVLGEADDAIHDLLDEMTAAESRESLLQNLATRQGFFVPRFGSPLGPVAKADDGRLPARSQIVTPNTELRSMFLIEPERGCSRGCTYCVMRRTTNGGMRTVPPERVLELVPDSVRRVGLVGAAVTDHPRVAELVRTLVETGREIGISSLRADRLTSELVGLLKAGGAKTLTTASDGASERMRDAIDRKTKESNLLRAAELAREHGLERLKLYMMLGLPGETNDDVDELVRFGTELSRIIPLSYGLAPFVAKRNTPMDGAPFESIPSIERKLERLRRGLRGRAEVRPTSVRWAWVEYMLAQSGVEAGLAALDAWRAGGSWAAWKKAFKEHDVKPFGAQRVLDGRRKLPTLAAWPVVATSSTPTTTEELPEPR
jgi:radical SAM superfamily enzyme YgiQ (UPF0313 family)